MTRMVKQRRSVPTPPPPHRPSSRVVLVGLLIFTSVVGFVVISDAISGETDYSPSSGEVDAFEASEADPIEERTCEIFFDISADAGDNVDSYDETRARFKDLYDGYGQTVSPSLATPLRGIVSALTSNDVAALEVAVGQMSSACASI